MNKTKIPKALQQIKVPAVFRALSPQPKTVQTKQRITIRAFSQISSFAPPSQQGERNTIASAQKIRVKNISFPINHGQKFARVHHQQNGLQELNYMREMREFNDERPATRGNISIFGKSIYYASAAFAVEKCLANLQQNILSYQDFFDKEDYLLTKKQLSQKLVFVKQCQIFDQVKIEVLNDALELDNVSISSQRDKQNVLDRKYKYLLSLSLKPNDEVSFLFQLSEISSLETLQQNYSMEYKPQLDYFIDQKQRFDRHFTRTGEGTFDLQEPVYQGKHLSIFCYYDFGILVPHIDVELQEKVSWPNTPWNDQKRKRMQSISKISQKRLCQLQKALFIYQEPFKSQLNQLFEVVDQLKSLICDQQFIDHNNFKINDEMKIQHIVSSMMPFFTKETPQQKWEFLQNFFLSSKSSVFRCLSKDTREHKDSIKPQIRNLFSRIAISETQMQDNFERHLQQFDEFFENLNNEYHLESYADLIPQYLEEDYQMIGIYDFEEAKKFKFINADQFPIPIISGETFYRMIVKYYQLFDVFGQVDYEDKPKEQSQQIDKIINTELVYHKINILKWEERDPPTEKSLKTEVIDETKKNYNSNIGKIPTDDNKKVELDFNLESDFWEKLIRISNKSFVKSLDNQPFEQFIDMQMPYYYSISIQSFKPVVSLINRFTYICNKMVKQFKYYNADIVRLVVDSSYYIYTSDFTNTKLQIESQKYQQTLMNIIEQRRKKQSSEFIPAPDRPTFESILDSSNSFAVSFQMTSKFQNIVNILLNPIICEMQVAFVERYLALFLVQIIIRILSKLLFAFQWYRALVCIYFQ